MGVLVRWGGVGVGGGGGGGGGGVCVCVCGGGGGGGGGGPLFPDGSLHKRLEMQICGV